MKFETEIEYLRPNSPLELKDFTCLCGARFTIKPHKVHDTYCHFCNKFMQLWDGLKKKPIWKIIQ